ncbi:MAG: sensor histidine kinase [Janthinobacterium lividum]
MLLGWLGCSGLLAGPAGARPGAPADTLFLHATNDGPWNHYFAYCLAPRAQPNGGAEAARLWAAGRFRALPPGRVFQVGYTQDRLWLRATVVNTLPQRTRFVWSLYAFVDSAALFVQPGGVGGLRPAAATSGRLVAAKRAFPARAICLPFWLEAHARAVVYLRVDNHTGALYLPTDLTTAEDYLAYESGFFMTKNWVWLLGVYLSSALFNLLLYAFLRDRIHLWYGAYVFFSTWFLLMEDGLDAWLLPPWAYGLGWRLGQYSVLLLALACGLRIMGLFVRLRQGWPHLCRLSVGLGAGGAACAGAYALLFGPLLAGPPAGLAWLNGAREVLLWALLAAGVGVLATVGARGRAPQRRLAALYGLTYACFFAGTVNFLLNRSGLTNIHLANPNALAWGLALELLALSALLTGRFRHALRQNAELRVRQLRERAAAGQRLIGAQEEERVALARELHDALAPGLTALHLAWQGRLVRQALAQAPPLLAEAHAQTEALLRQLRHDVRTLSHARLPVPADELPPLPAALALLVETLGLTDDGPHVTARCDPDADGLPAPLAQAAYRIVAELLHNALRHAQASYVRVGVRCSHTGLCITVADDGRGFDPHGLALHRGGLGLRGVQARASYLRGRVLISSQPGQGTVVTVELPVF